MSFFRTLDLIRLITRREEISDKIKRLYSKNAENKPNIKQQFSVSLRQSAISVLPPLSRRLVEKPENWYQLTSLGPIGQQVFLALLLSANEQERKIALSKVPASYRRPYEIYLRSFDTYIKDEDLEWLQKQINKNSHPAALATATLQFLHHVTMANQRNLEKPPQPPAKPAAPPPQPAKPAPQPDKPQPAQQPDKPAQQPQPDKPQPPPQPDNPPPQPDKPQSPPQPAQQPPADDFRVPPRRGFRIIGPPPPPDDQTMINTTSPTISQPAFVNKSLPIGRNITKII